jgi:P4 family phage/plasmid primase-like protien
MDTTTNTMLTAALEYAELGLAVFPLVPGNKIPLGWLAPNGFKDATKDPERVREFWQAAPNANIGIACGPVSGGLFVLDVDTHNADGKETLRLWLEESGVSLPVTATAITGGNGIHYYFKSGEPVRSRGGIMPGIDIKGEGGYIVASPSVHPYGASYRWETGRSLTEVPIAEADDVISGILKHSTTGSKRQTTNKSRGRILEGDRNDTLTSHLGGLRYKGWELDALEAEAVRFNRERLSPPLDDAEALSVAQSVSKYSVGYEAFGMAGSPVDGVLLEKLAELHPEDASRYKNTEQGWGYLFADAFKDEARFCPERKAWFIHDGIRWKHDPVALTAGERVKRLADALHVYLVQVPDTMREQLYKGWGMWQRRSARDTILKDAAGVYPIALADFDTNPYLLNVLNGTLNLETGNLQPHSADDLITRLAPVTYDPQASFPRWAQFIDEVMDGDTSTAHCLQQCLGYALTGSTELEKMFILYGATSRNGKSTLTETVLGVLGEYAASADPEMLSTARNTAGGMKATEDLAKLAGVRFVSVSEPPKGMSLNGAKVKQWTGSDTVRARFLHENSFEFKPQFTFFVNTNDLPLVSDTALFKSKRMVVIPFARHFTEAEQDTTLKQQFSTGVARSAVLNWLHEGWQSLQAHGLILPDAVTSAVGEYSAESDTIRRFVDDRLEVDAGGEIKTTDLLKTFQAWANANGVESLNASTFKGELLRAGLSVKRSRPKTGGNATSLLKGYGFKDAGSGLFNP